MSSQLPSIPFSPLVEIHSWSGTLPMWQRDALRRIVTIGTLKVRDLDELESICRHAHSALNDGEVSPSVLPLDVDHLPASSDHGDNISLVSLSNVMNVNRLPGDQTLSFEPGAALTVIYGKNGAGKSGYARIIKKACRCRGQARSLLPDVRMASPPAKASARLVLREGDQDRPVDWTDGVPSDRRFSRIFVFDADCADHYIDESDGTAFTPFGLDILEKLSGACDDVKKRLTERHRTLLARIEAAKREWRVPSSTTVGKLLADLSASTPPDEVQKAGLWTQADASRLDQINETLASNPRLRAQNSRAAAVRISGFVAAVRKAISVLDDPSLHQLCAAIAQVEEATKAAAVFAGTRFDGSYLNGTGGKLWGRLWAAAREFSIGDAYPALAFPSDDEDTRCVLCQTNLNEEARARMRRFDEFMSNQASTELNAARERLAALNAKLLDLGRVSDEWKRVESDLSGEDGSRIEVFATFASVCDQRQDAFKASVISGDWSSLPELPPSPELQLMALADVLVKRASDVESAADPSQHQRLLDEKAELEGRKWLAEAVDSVLGLIPMYGLAQSLDKCISETATVYISRKSKSLYDSHVTSSFKKRFRDELEFLEPTRLQVELYARGEKGGARFSLKVTGSAKPQVSHVASEGEKRCIALALFLAELSQSSDKSALVFDDPVSSLDHERRYRIAERLVRESRERQVIVFTHDLSFVCDLEFHCDAINTTICGRHIDWSADSPGRCHERLPWKGQTTYKEMMKDLRDMCYKARSIATQHGESEYQEFGGTVVSEIRTAAERIVEEVLFNGVLRRHDSQIKMGCLEGVGRVEYEDYQAVFAVWRACSRLPPTHASPRAMAQTVPLPGRLDEFVANLEEVAKRVKDRRKQPTAATPADGLKVTKGS